MYCLVGMHDLRAAPFSLTYNTLVVAKVLARNERGWSAASDANVDGARIQVEPLAMGATMRGGLTGPTQIDVYWDSITTPQDGGSPVLSYHLQYDNATASTTWYDVVGLAPDSLATSILVSSQLVSGTVYGFRVRARNIFGWGPYSVVTNIKAAREPGTPVAPITSIDAATGDFAIDWTAPDARGDAITAYVIQIAVKPVAPATTPTVWLPYTTTCNGSLATIVASRHCTVPMAVLTGATYGYSYSYLTGGDLVQVRVKAANP